MTLADDTTKLVPTHPEDADLVAYVDGELSPSEEETTREHLEGCWDCRTRMTALQDAIGRFMRIRQGVLPDGVPPAPAAMEPFRARLDRHGGRASSGFASLRAFLGRWAALPSRGRLRPAWAALTVVTFVVLTGPLWAHSRLLAELRAFAEQTWSGLVGGDRRAAEPTRASRDLPQPVPRPLESPLKRRPRALPISYANSIASDAEAAIASSLHRLDACLGEEINVFQMSDGSILVQGLVESKQRRDQIAGSLAALRVRAQVELYTPEGLTTGAELYEPPEPRSTPNPSVPNAPVRFSDKDGLELPLYDRLRRQVAAEAGGDTKELQRRIAAFANETITESRKAFFHAWALRNLDVQFSAARSSRLSHASLAGIDDLRVQHRQAVAETAGRLLEKLSALEPSLAASFSNVGRAGRDGARLLRLVSEQDELVRSLLTASASAKPDADLARLVVLLKQLG
jgi:hypothetical protein